MELRTPDVTLTAELDRLGDEIAELLRTPRRRYRSSARPYS
jgi:hypothetical protein